MQGLQFSETPMFAATIPYPLLVISGFLVATDEPFRGGLENGHRTSWQRRSVQVV